MKLADPTIAFLTANEKYSLWFYPRSSAFVSQTSKPLHGLAALVGARHALRNPDSRICG
jgi:hypothetical protein